MAVKQVHVSDVSGREPGSGEELTRIVILEHPDASGPVTVELLPDEVTALKLDDAQQMVRLEVQRPGERRPRVVAVPQDVFDALAAGRSMREVLAEAELATRSTRKRPAQEPSRPARKNYGSIEYAGEVHRGRITDAEREIVSSNLDEVNKRLREKDMREIDPADPKMRKQYGLDSPTAQAAS